MTWKPGQSGNPLGSTSNKMLTDALRVVLNDYAKDTSGAYQVDDNGKKIKNIRMIAAQLVKRARAGDTVAIRECFDRLDGKPQQDVNVKGVIENHIIQLIQGLDEQPKQPVQSTEEAGSATKH